MRIPTAVVSTFLLALPATASAADVPTAPNGIALVRG